MAKVRVAVLISGRGSNMQSLVTAAENKNYPAEIVVVVSNKKDAKGIRFAEKKGIPVQVVEHSLYDNRQRHEDEIDKVVREAKAELICLAGYMRVLSESFVNKWEGKIINIHPSLLPSFPGVDTHERALKRGVRVHGCSVHFVTNELDGGPIIAQGVVPVHPNGNAETLAARVLEVEHRLYPHALGLIASGKIRWGGDKNIHTNEAKIENLLLYDDKNDN